jgi:hypothetical protein
MPIHICGQSVSARRGKRYTEIGLLIPLVWAIAILPVRFSVGWQALAPGGAVGVRGDMPVPQRVHLRGRGLHSSIFTAQLEVLRDTSLTLELNLSTFRTHARVGLGYRGRSQLKLSGKGLSKLKLSGKGQSELNLSGDGNECKPLLRGGPGAVRRGAALRAGGRGLHSSTFWLNLSAFCGTGVHVGVYFVSATAQIELTSGRV